MAIVAIGFAAILDTLDGRVGGDDVRDDIFGIGSSELFKKVKRSQKGLNIPQKF